MYLTLKEYRILSDFYFLHCDNILYRKAALTGYKNADDLHKKTGILLDKLRADHIALSAKNGAKVLEKRNAGKERAQHWQFSNAAAVHSWQWCCEWAGRWERIGRKYRLIREFKENGIL